MERYKQEQTLMKKMRLQAEKTTIISELSKSTIIIFLKKTLQI